MAATTATAGFPGPGGDVRGGCLCAAVRFEVRGRLHKFYHCHCSRCRKATGAGHGTLLTMMNATLFFSRGEPLLKRYKVPEAARFTRQFCSNCGSWMPRFVPELDLVVIPAGSLDSEIPVKPQARVFWDSRAEWSCDSTDLPQFATSPAP